MLLHKSILVVDDEFALRYTLSLILQGAGYNVRVASGGLDALKCIQTGGFDLIILDIAMPDLDGLRVLSQIQRDYPDTPVILLTADASPEKMSEAKMKGASEYLIKPIEPDRVLAIVEKIIAGRLITPQ